MNVNDHIKFMLVLVCTTLRVFCKLITKRQHTQCIKSLNPPPVLNTLVLGNHQSVAPRIATVNQTTYSWLRCPSVKSDISACETTTTTSNTYVASAADVGKTIRMGTQCPASEAVFTTVTSPRTTSASLGIVGTKTACHSGVWTPSNTQACTGAYAC